MESDWMSELSSTAARLAPKRSARNASERCVENPGGRHYYVGVKLGPRKASTQAFKIYECIFENDCVGVLKVAAEVAKNGVLDREALVLRKLRDEAAELEAEYAKVKDRPDKMLNYQICFPNLVDSFVCESQGRRRINVVSFTNVEDDIGRLKPIGWITSRDRLRVDPKTSAWIMGKLLKLLAFAHNAGVSLGFVEGDNLIIEPDQHYVMAFDWSRAELGPSGVDKDVAAQEISLAAREIIALLGGDPDSGALPEDEQLKDDQYERMLVGLARGVYNDANEAHASFYRLIRSLWPRGFHPFTAYPLD